MIQEPIVIVPQPESLKRMEGKFVVDRSTVIVSGAGSEAKAKQLAEFLRPATGFELPIRERAEANAFDVALDAKLTQLGSEGYRLVVEPKRVILRAAEPAGLFYGIQTIRQLLPADVFSPTQVRAEWAIPCVEIQDKPRFQWRGLMMDSCRYFMPLDFVKKTLDLLALHKMNVFHWHLTEDQGWRLEIKKYPKLTEVGTWRKHSLVGHYNENRGNPKYDGKRHGGFYTQDDAREIVRYAAERHITVVPEIEMPGHAQAAIAAYPELGNTGRQLEVSTMWGVHTHVFNVEETTIKFLQDVLTEVLEIFPSKFIHIGGDECPKDEWKASPRAQARMKELGVKDEHELQSWFVKRMDTFLDERGRRLIGWDEILEGGLAPGATVMSWRGTQGGIAAAQAGHDVVMSPTSHCYLDFYQSKAPGEPLAIGGFTPIDKVYGFEPVPKELSADRAKHILGAQGNVWTEYIPTPEKFEYMAFPRASALSEVVWTPATGKDLGRFMAGLPVHLKRLDHLRVNYRRLDGPAEAPFAEWKSGEVGETPVVREWPLPEIPEAGEYAVTFSYSGGDHRLDIFWAEIVADGKVVARDEHEGVTGGFDRANVYRFKVPSALKGAVLRARVRADGGSDSNGGLTLLRL